MKIVAFFGPQQSGKTTAAKILAAHPRWCRLSFADTLYAMVDALLGCDSRKLDKSQPLPELGGHTVRFVLQTLGTEWGRNMLVQDIWVNAMKRRIEESLEVGYSIVIDDCRFQNEYEMLRDHLAVFVEMARSGISDMVGSHSSEVEWTGFKRDLRIENNGSEEELQEMLYADFID